MPNVDLLILNAAQVVTCGDGAPRRGRALADVALIPHGGVAIADGKIVAVGPSAEIAAAYTAPRTLDASGRAVVPGFVDPHTHLVYAGDRIDEFEQRIQGRTYMEIMAAGGGIRRTMHACRAASEDDLYTQSLARLDALFRLGTTTVEIKTGYGLDHGTELKLLRVIAALDQAHPVDIVPTFMPAHAVPPGHTADSYLDEIIASMLPAALDWYQHSHFAAQGTPMFVDVFCEANAFDLRQTERLLDAALALGLPIKAHVDEFTALGGTPAAIARRATSVDHLDVTPRAQLQQLAESDTVGVVIPAVNFNLGSTHFADARILADLGGIVALTTDLNPGSAPCPSMPLVMAIACRYQRLLPAEALNASTVNAAAALGLTGRVGAIAPGLQADLLLLRTSDYRHLAYSFGDSLVDVVVKRGVV